MNDLERFCLAVPKAELHVHIEGTLEPELMFELAARNRLSIPYDTPEEIRAAYGFRDLQSFLDIYYQGAAVLRTEQDFFDLMRAYLERAEAQGVRRAEIFFDPQAHTARGVGFEVFMRGLARGIEFGREVLGMSTDLILCFLRHLSGEAAVATLEKALAYRDWFVGVGLDSSEVGNPPERFEEAFRLARAEGLHSVAHAGEEGPASYIVGALDVLGAERIDHGVRAIEDPDLVDRLVREGVPLTVCPLSNVKLRVFETLAEHNLATLLRGGVKVTINSDDPAYFGGYLADNYIATAEALGLSQKEIVAIARNSFEAAFLAEDVRAGYLAELDGFLAGFRINGHRGLD